MIRCISAQDLTPSGLKLCEGGQFIRKIKEMVRP